MKRSTGKSELSQAADIPNRFGRTPEELEAARDRIEDARRRAEAGLLRDDTEWACQKREEERRRLTRQ
jgi:hypothetical protein